MNETQLNIDILWICICSGLVFIMQAGFLCLEIGVTRRKNSINLAIKNLVDFCLSTVVFWLVGFGLMFRHYLRGCFRCLAMAYHHPPETRSLHSQS